MLRGMLFNHKLVLFSFFFMFFFYFPTYLSFDFPDFCLSHFPPFNGESETMPCIVLLTCSHRNNQSSTYELFLIQIGGTKVQPCQVWTLSGLRFLTGSWLIEKVSHFAPGYAIEYIIIVYCVMWICEGSFLITFIEKLEFIQNQNELDKFYLVSWNFLWNVSSRYPNCCSALLLEFWYPISTLSGNFRILTYFQHNAVISFPELPNNELCVYLSNVLVESAQDHQKWTYVCGMSLGQCADWKSAGS